MDQERTVFLTVMVSLCGLMLSILSLTGGLEYFVATLGFIIIVNLMIFGSYILTGRSNSEETSVNPVSALQERFAQGELTEEEFEQKLDQIVETQDIADEVDDEKINLLSEN